MIWLVIGWFVLAIETLATGNQNPNPETEITLTWPVFLFASVSVAAVGLLMGFIEIVWIGKWFRAQRFWRTILYKMGIYLLFMFLVNALFFPLAASIEMEISPLDGRIWKKFSGYLASLSFLRTLVSLSFSIFVSVLYAGISENLGHGVLSNFFTGRYHTPKEEARIFMFLDLKSSTTLAEQLGHRQYFRFLQSYYSELSDAIINHLGEVYQYIGDEVVITWKLGRGLANLNCIRCFFAMRKAIKDRSAYFRKTYGVVPDFKAGLHLGHVTTGEIGALKKEIFFTGDVLNVTSRIQGLCNEYGKDLIVSDQVRAHLQPPEKVSYEPLGPLHLKGRAQSIELFAINQVDGLST